MARDNWLLSLRHEVSRQCLKYPPEFQTGASTEAESIRTGEIPFVRVRTLARMRPSAVKHASCAPVIEGND